MSRVLGDLFEHSHLRIVQVQCAYLYGNIRSESLLRITTANGERNGKSIELGSSGHTCADAAAVIKLERTVDRCKAKWKTLREVDIEFQPSWAP